jgi:preprotein translocase subunit SecE
MAEKKPNILKRIGRAFLNMRGEMKRVVWPSRKQVVNNTGIVLVFMALAAVVIGLFDAGMALIISQAFGA